MPLKQYPYQQLSLKNIKGEEWKDIPGLEGYYMLSNLGRVRRLEYEMQYRNGAIYTKEEKIIKPYIIRQRNNFKNDTSYYLASRVTIEGIRYNLTIARLVYYCFIKNFNLQSNAINILCKDGDGLNIHPGNLLVATLSEKAKRMVERKRMESHFKKLSAADKKKQRKSIVEAKSKQVSQYTLAGKRIKTYSSAAAAERATGIFATSIRMVASGDGITAGGFAWKWGNAAMVDLQAIRQDRKTAFRKQHGQRVTQYDFNGNKIAQYPSLQDAQAATGSNQNAIRLVLKAVYKSAKGFYWKKGYGKDKIDLSGYAWGRESMSIAQSKKVMQLSLKGIAIKTFPSIKEAASTMGVTPSVIVDCCRGRQQSSCNYQWKYAS